MVRVRFAPSPTGLPHVGNIRTALFNWLFAKHHSGKFILRIEDTDRERYEPEAVDAIMRSLRWLGILWDEGPDVGGEFGPYFQSQRIHIYHEYARKLVAEGHAYYCDCSSERLEQIRQQRMALKLSPMYDRKCREREIKSDPTDPNTVVRLKMPTSGKTTFYDVLRGEVVFENELLDDIVLIKSDGFPTYHMAVVVDDHLMKITHIFRGEEWISSAGKHIVLYRALGWEPPIFVHLPIILGPDKTKLSKRHGATTIESFEEQGFLPEAMFNYLALLGWSAKDDTEIMTKDELIRRFDIDGFSSTSAVFDIEKLKWMNGEYIRLMDHCELTKRLMPFYRKWGFCTDENPCDEKFLDKVSIAVRERLKLLTDMKVVGTFFFEEPHEYDKEGVKKYFSLEASKWLEELSEQFLALEDWTESALEETVRKCAEHFNIGAAKLIHTVRLAVSGMRTGPSLFQILEIFGKENVINRLQRAIKWILIHTSE